MGPLTEQQVRSFKRDGALVVRGFVVGDVIESWVQQYEAKATFSCADPASFPGAAAATFEGPEPTWRTDPILTELPQIQALSTQLGGQGGGFMTSYPFDGHMIPTWPAADKAAADWQPGAAGHLDNYGGNGWTGGLNHGFVITVYLEDIDEQGGCFTYWPRSHESTHEYFRQNPSQIDGSFGGAPEWEEFWNEEPHASRGGDSARSKHTGVQFVGKKGDICIWHGGLMHSGSMNASGTTPRLALFGSFRNAKMHTPDDGIKPPDFEPLDSPKRVQELRYDIPEDLWEHWGEEVKSLSVEGTSPNL